MHQSARTFLAFFVIVASLALSGYGIAKAASGFAEDVFLGRSSSTGLMDAAIGIAAPSSAADAAGTAEATNAPETESPEDHASMGTLHTEESEFDDDDSQGGSSLSDDSDEIFSTQQPGQQPRGSGGSGDEDGGDD